MTWEYTQVEVSVDVTTNDTLDSELDAGWEPYAVTYLERGGYEFHEYRGCEVSVTNCLFVHHLRRQVQP